MQRQCSGGQPTYSASIEVQNINTISYGDPIFISVRMTPLKAIDIESIALIPQGELAKLYGTTITSEAGSVVPKWPCSFGSSVRPASIPFFVSCEIRPSFRNSQYFAIDTLLLPASRHKLLLLSIFRRRSLPFMMVIALLQSKKS